MNQRKGLIPFIIQAIFFPMFAFSMLVLFFTVKLFLKLLIVIIAVVSWMIRRHQLRAATR